MNIGIDWSINSAAACCKSIDGRYQFIFIINKENKCSHKISELNDCQVIVYEKGYDSLENAERMAHILINTIKTLSDVWKDNNINIAFENYAYSAKGNSLLSIVENTTIVKYLLKKEFGECINVYAPTSVKKNFTGNGRASKDDMLHAFQNMKVDTIFHNIVKHYHKSVKPAEDGIDAFAVLKKMESE